MATLCLKVKYSSLFSTQLWFHAYCRYFIRPNFTLLAFVQESLAAFHHLLLLWVSTGSRCLWAPGRHFRKYELEETCPVSRGTHGPLACACACQKNQHFLQVHLQGHELTSINCNLCAFSCVHFPVNICMGVYPET